MAVNNPNLAAIVHRAYARLFDPLARHTYANTDTATPCPAFTDLVAQRVALGGPDTPLHPLTRLSAKYKNHDVAVLKQPHWQDILAEVAGLCGTYNTEFTCGRVMDQNPEAAHRNRTENIMQAIVMATIKDLLIPLVWNDVGDVVQRLCQTQHALMEASLVRNNDPIFVDHEEGASESASPPPKKRKRRSSSLPTSVTETREIVTTIKTIECRFRTQPIKGRRHPTRKGPEATSVGILLRETRKVIRQDAAKQIYVPAKVVMDTKTAAVLQHGDEPSSEEQVAVSDYASSVYGMATHHGLCTANAVDYKHHKPDCKTRLQTLHNIDDAVGGAVCITNFEFDIVLQHATGGDIAAARRCIVCIMIMVTKQSTTLTLAHVLQCIDIVTGMSAYEHYNSYTPRNDSKLSFFMWWHCLRKIFKDNMVFLHPSVPEALAAQYAVVVAALPRGYMDSDEDVRTKADAHWWAVTALRSLAAADIPMVCEPATVLNVMERSICAQWDVAYAVEDLARTANVDNAHFVGKPFAARLYAIQQLPDYSPLLEGLLPNGKFALVVARFLWLQIAAEARLVVDELSCFTEIIALCNATLDRLKMSWDDPIWDALKDVCDCVHPVLHIVTWSAIELEMADTFCNTVLRDVEEDDMPGEIYTIWVMQRTHNMIAMPLLSSSAHTDLLRSMGFAETTIRKRFFSMYPAAGVWLKPTDTVSALPFSPDDSVEEIESRIASVTTGCMVFHATSMPDVTAHTAVPSDMLKNTCGRIPGKSLFTIHDVCMPAVFSLPWWIWNNMTWTWEEVDRGSYTAITAVPLPVHYDDEAHAPFVGFGIQLVYLVFRQGSHVKCTMFARPVTPLLNFVGNPEQIAKDLFLDKLTTPVKANKHAAITSKQHAMKVKSLPPWAKKVAKSAPGKDLNVQTYILDKARHNGILDVLTLLASRISDQYPDCRTQRVKAGANMLCEQLDVYFKLPAYNKRIFRLYTSIDIEDNRRVNAQAREQYVRVADLEAQIKCGQTRSEALTGNPQEMLSALDDIIFAANGMDSSQQQEALQSVRESFVWQSKQNQERDFITGALSIMKKDVQEEKHKLQQLDVSSEGRQSRNPDSPT